MLSSQDNFYIILTYGRCEGDAEAAFRRIRRERPHIRLSSANYIRRLANRLYSTGCFDRRTRDTGTGRITRSRLNVDRVREIVQEYGTVSVRDVSRQTGISRSSVHRILRLESMHPFKFVRVQELLPADFNRRLEYCRWLVDELSRNPAFLPCILWTDESLFTREGCFNGHNLHMWSVENPRAVRQRASQTRWSVNLWAGICGEYVIGPYMLPARLDGSAFLTFLEHALPDLMDDVPYAIRQNMYFQMDGAPAHYAANVRAHLNEAFQDRWIGRGGPVAWPPRSPDLNPLDFFLWGYLKDEVYKRPLTTPEEMVARLHGAIANITPATLRRVMRETIRRARLCIEQNGGHFEQLRR